MPFPTSHSASTVSSGQLTTNLHTGPHSLLHHAASKNIFTRTNAVQTHSCTCIHTLQSEWCVVEVSQKRWPQHIANVLMKAVQAKGVSLLWKTDSVRVRQTSEHHWPPPQPSLGSC